jgi:hypothetical protein
VDLLQHEVAVAALLRGDGVPENPVREALERASLAVGDPDPRRIHPRHVPILEEDHVPRPRDERHGIGGDVVLPVPDPEHDRRAHARRDEDAGLAGRGDDDRVGPRQAPRRAPHRGVEVSLELRLDLVGEDLGVRVADEAMAGGHERRLTLGEVFEDAVVDDDDAARAVGVRMRVGLGRAAVGCPAGVTDARRAAGGGVSQPREEVRELAGTAQHRKGPVGERGDPGRVVAAVFESLQALD